MYFLEARNAEIAPTIAKMGIINHENDRKMTEKSDKNGIKSSKSDFCSLNKRMRLINTVIARTVAVQA